MLHWFHYRPRRLKGSWKQEEVLTWELIRALSTLPQRFFLRRILERIAPSAAVAALLSAERICITPYPSLELEGNKKNCKSDIGFGLPGFRSTVWIEAKTARFKTLDLRVQLENQFSAMRALSGDQEVCVATLLPTSKALPDFPNVSWKDIEECLRACASDLKNMIGDDDLMDGYVHIATELLDRIATHPNRVDGWV